LGSDTLRLSFGCGQVVTVTKMASFKILLRSVTLSAWIFGLLGWVYAVAIQLRYPEALALPLAHFSFWPFSMRLDTFGILCFALSWVMVILWRLLGDALESR
jgi:hypothetical protein